MGFQSPNQMDGMLMAVEDALRKRVFDGLKAPLMKMAEAEIDKAVDEAINQLNIDLQGYKDFNYMRDIINVIVKRADNGR